MTRRIGWVTLASLVCCCPHPARANVGVLGSEFQINTYTTASQTEPAVAARVNGDFVVVWQSVGQDGDSGGIFARQFDALGTPFAGESQVNLTSASNQGAPSITDATLDVGFGPVPTFQVVWASSQAGGLDVFGLKPGFYEFETNTYTTGNQTIPRVVGLTGGGFATVWHDGSQFPLYERLVARIYDTTYAPVTGEFQIGPVAYPGSRRNPALARNASGGFVVSFADDYDSGLGVFVYDGSGTLVNGVYPFEGFTAIGSANSLSDIAVDPSGDTFLVWDNGSSDDIRAIRTDSLGNPTGSTFQINTYTTGAQIAPRIAANASGEFLVVWQSPHDGDGTGVFGRLYTSDGNPAGSEFQINSSTTGDTDYASAAALPDGNFVVVWHAYDQDDVFARRVGDLCPAAPTSGCRTAEKSVLLIKDNADDTKDKLLWKWVKGQTTTPLELGAPEATRRYALCVYDAAGRVLSAEVAPDAIKWADLKYKDPSGTSNGVQKVLLKPGTSNNAKALVKGKGVNLPDPTLGTLATPITAQLINNETSLCFEGTYGVGDVIKNDAAQLKAKAGN